MKLKTSYKKKKKPAVDKKKAEIKKKEKTGLSKNYSSKEEYDIDYAEIPLSKMRYGIVDSCICKSIITDGNTIEVNDSWVEVLLILVSAMIADCKNNNKVIHDEMCRYKIANRSLNIEKVYGKISFDNELGQYKVYKIPNTEYYLEIIEDSSIILDAIVHLCNYMDIQYCLIKFNVENKKYLERKEILDNSNMDSEIVEVNGLEKLLTYGVYLRGAIIFGEFISCNNLQTFLFLYCNMIVKVYSEELVDKLGYYKECGIEKKCKNSTTNVKEIADSEYQVYCDNDLYKIIEFIEYSMKILDIDTDDIKFNLCRLSKEPKKEWQID